MDVARTASVYKSAGGVPRPSHFSPITTMGFFNHDDENDRQAYEQVQQGNEAHFSKFLRLSVRTPSTWPRAGLQRTVGRLRLDAHEGDADHQATSSLPALPPSMP